MADVDVKIDRKIGSFFLDSMKNAKERLWIMSPWLSPEYARLAIEKKKQGLNVKVITSNNYVRGHKEALQELTEVRKEVKKPENRKLRIIGIILIPIGVIIAIFTAGIGLILSVVGIILYFIGRGKALIYWISKIGEENLLVYNYIPAHPVHAKVYIIDDLVVVGSVNLTKIGLQRSVESVALIKSGELASDLSKILSELDKTIRLKRIPNYEVGKEVRAKHPSRRF